MKHLTPAGTKLISKRGEEVLASFRKACAWAGVDRGRALKYEELFQQYHEKGQRSREHTLAYLEISDIIETYILWEPHIEHFPGLKEKIRASIIKGPVLRDDELHSTSSNRARNDAFIHLLAGKLLNSRISVRAVDGIARKGFKINNDSDITFEESGSLIDVQGKRVLSLRALRKGAKKARAQIHDSETKTGIIAIDASPVLVPPGSLLDSTSEDRLGSEVYGCLGREIQPRVQPELRDYIIGMLLYARVPARTFRKSSLLGADGKPIKICRLDTVSALMFVSNTAAPNVGIMARLNESFRFVEWAS